MDVVAKNENSTHYNVEMQVRKEKCCLEDYSLKLQDGSVSIFLSTKGKNDVEVSEELVKFLKYVGATAENSSRDFEDSYVTKLQESIRRIKADREIGGRYMFFQELLDDERKEGLEEGCAEGLANGLVLLLESFGEVSEELRAEIMSQRDAEVLKSWIKLAVQVKDVDAFILKFKE